MPTVINNGRIEDEAALQENIHSRNDSPGLGTGSNRRDASINSVCLKRVIVRSEEPSGSEGYAT